jgi:hypothetical protein
MVYGHRSELEPGSGNSTEDRITWQVELEVRPRDSSSFLLQRCEDLSGVPISAKVVPRVAQKAYHGRRIRLRIC